MKERHMRGRNATLFLALAALLGCFMPQAAAAADKIDRDSLVADVRELAHLIETVHPDPYVNGGGKAAFDQRLQATLAGIPADGMTQADFYRLLRPFVTAIGDAHTWLRDAYDYASPAPGGIPLYFGVVGNELYVLAVPEEQYRPMLGAILVSVEGVPFAELLERSRAMVSAENQYQLLRNLGYAGMLWSRPFLGDLVPEWRDSSRVELVLRHQDGTEIQHTIPVPTGFRGPFINPGSRVKRPAAGPSGFTYAFLDSERTTALLVVDHMEGYREAFEDWLANDPAGAEQSAGEMYRQILLSDPPDDVQAVLAGLPSATETMRSLVQDMRAAGTKTLLVDLRRNGGGNSAMYSILLHFLYGRDVLIKAQCHRTEIKRVAGAGYDSSGDWYNRIRRDPGALADFRAEFEREVDRMPTFAAEYRSGEFERHYLPANVMVLISPQTFSSGYTMMYYLYRAGATIVGTPSAQAGNCFGETFGFELKHSGLTGTISQKRYVYFHDDPEMGMVLRPHHAMTYEELRSYGFDLNAEILLAMDLCRH